MPEGHTIHRVARDHTRDFVGEALSVASPQGRFAKEAKRLNGRTLETVDAWGKHLFYRWEGGRTVHVHLGLYGKFRTHKAPPPEPRGLVRLRVVGARKAFDLNGPNRCELVTMKAEQAILDRLGPDPLRNDADPDAAWRRISRSRAPIAALLLNQAVVAGVGNVYRAEVLHLLEMSPDRPGRDVSRDEFERMWSLLVDLMHVGVRLGKIVVADPADVGKPRSRMNGAERLLVYKHDWCGRCDTLIESWSVGGRTIYACPHCQAH